MAGKNGGARPGAGRKKGSTNRPQLRDHLTEKDILDLVKKARELAQAGDTKMLAFILEHAYGKAPQAIEAKIDGSLMITFDKAFTKVTDETSSEATGDSE